MLPVDLLFSFGFTFWFACLSSFYYYRRFQNKEVAFAVVLYALLVFAIVYFVSFEESIGLGIGLLGILSLIRLRSTQENLIDIGFIFYAITLGLLGASVTSLELLFVVDFSLCLILMSLSGKCLFKQARVRTKIIFDDICVSSLADQAYLRKIILEKYGIQPLEIKVSEINYLKDSVTLSVTYTQKSTNVSELTAKS